MANQLPVILDLIYFEPTRKYEDKCFYDMVREGEKRAMAKDPKYAAFIERERSFYRKRRQTYQLKGVK